MKKILYLAFSLALTATIASSCERDISSLNVDPKKPEVVPSVNLFASSQQYLATQWSTPSVNSNITRFFTQQWTETQYVDETNYVFTSRNQPQSHYNSLMRDVIGPLKKAKTFVENEAESTDYSTADQAAIKTNKKAVIEILSIYAWVNLVDTFGNIPYTESLKVESGNQVLQPKYDDAATIYIDLQKRLDAAISSLNTSLPAYNDLVYKGDTSKWKKFGNSIKLLMGLNLSDVNPTAAKQLIESAVVSGVITTGSDSYNFPFLSGQFSNPIYQNLVASGRNDFIPSDVYLNYIKGNNDPRLSVYFTVDKNGNYTGGKYGSLNTYANFSHISSKITTDTYPGYMMDDLYVEFMLLEAAAKGFSVGDTAASLYAKSITLSMTKWGVDSTSINAYLLAHPYDAVNWKKSIAGEAWVAMNNRGFEAWYFWRRLDYPSLTAPGTAEGLVYRMPYSVNEYSTNKTNVEAAAKAIGGDKMTTKIFWDKF